MPASTLVGYARTSTTDQKAGLEAQLRALDAAGCTKIFARNFPLWLTRGPNFKQRSTG